MTDFRGISLLLILTSLICCCGCEDSLTSVIQRLNHFDRKLHRNKKEILGMEENVLNLIELSKTGLRAELMKNIREIVMEALVEILKGDALQDLLSNEVVSELRQLQKGYRQMERNLHNFSTSLRDLQDKMDIFQQPRLKNADASVGRDSCDVCFRDKYRLENELHKSNLAAESLKTDIIRLLKVNETCQSKMSQLKQSLAVHASLGSVQDVNTTSSSPVSASVTMTTSPQLTSVTTVRPEEKKRRILIAPQWSSTSHQFLQLNIHRNSLCIYQHHTMKTVSSIAYIAKTQKLLIGRYLPDRIMSSTLDTSYTTVVRKGVRTLGMAVDEERDIVFMTTEAPRYTISRMSTQGKKFTAIIDLSTYGGLPAGITLDKKQKKIYACNAEKMFILTYNGQGLATLAQGTAMHAVIWDHTAGVLYYNNEKKLMKVTVSSNVSIEVTTLDVIPWSMSLYRGTIYYGSYSAGYVNSGTVGAVDLTFNKVPHILKSIHMTRIQGLYIQLIP